MSIPVAKYFHTAGIVSLAGPSEIFQMEWHDALTPLSPNLTFIENAVAQCALAGCDTVWIVCDDDITPLLRRRLGDWVLDPVWANRSLEPSPFTVRKEIPIFYVPVHPDDIDRRDSRAWGVLSGAQTATRIGAQISKWTRPQAFFVGQPFGVMSPTTLREARHIISSPHPVCFTFDDQSYRDDERLPFTFCQEDLEPLIRTFKEAHTTLWQQGRRLPRSERYSGRYATFASTFEGCFNKMEKIKVQWYHKVGDWKEYTNYISSPEGEKFPTEISFMLGPNTFNHIPTQEENNNERI